MILTITPYLFYEDVAAAVTWLSRVFGFRETIRYTEPDGLVTHAELTFGGESVMIGRFGANYRSPKRTGYISMFVLVLVDDVEDHFRHSVEAGAKILNPPQDEPYGQRQYTAEDPEGHRWRFAEQVRDVLPEEWGAEDMLVVSEPER